MVHLKKNSLQFLISSILLCLVITILFFFFLLPLTILLSKYQSMSLSEVQEIVKDREYLVSCNPRGRRVGHDLVTEQYLAIKIPQFTCCLADEH